jgi:hypothetical protein
VLIVAGELAEILVTTLEPYRYAFAERRLEDVQRSSTHTQHRW